MKLPHLLLLTIETLRADVLNGYGYHTPLTPTLDKLAAAGIRFQQARSGGSWTEAVSPVILTSSYAAMDGGCLAPERPSPVSSLARHGYPTTAFSTNLHLGRATGQDRGVHRFSDLRGRGGNSQAGRL